MRHDTEGGPCLLCGKTSLDLVREYRSATAAGKMVFDGRHLFRCTNCGLIQVCPLPKSSDLVKYYTSDYRSGGKGGSAEANLRLFPKDNIFFFSRGESIYELLSSYLAKKRLEVLDIGAGFGHILYSLGARYPNARLFAIETSDVCVKHLSSLGIEVFTEPVEVIIPRLTQNFHIIILSHVVEHFLDPKTILIDLKKHLHRDGLLYIEVPNCPFDYLKRTYEGDEPHITFFTPSVLHTFLEQIGYKVMFCETAGFSLHQGMRYRKSIERLASNVLPTRIKSPLKRFYLRGNAMRKTREKAFFEYGGHRTWIRAISTKGEVNSV